MPRLLSSAALALVLLAGCPECVQPPPLAFPEVNDRITGAWQGEANKNDEREFSAEIVLRSDGTFAVIGNDLTGTYEASGKWGTDSPNESIDHFGSMYFAVECSTLRYFPSGQVMVAFYEWATVVGDHTEIIRFNGPYFDDRSHVPAYVDDIQWLFWR